MAEPITDLSEAIEVFQNDTVEGIARALTEREIKATDTAVIADDVLETCKRVSSIPELVGAIKLLEQKHPALKPAMMSARMRIAGVGLRELFPDSFREG